MSPSPATPAPRGRLFRTRSGSLVDTEELRRRRAARRQQQEQEEEQREREREQQRQLDEALLATVLHGSGHFHPGPHASVVSMGMDEVGRWRILRPDRDPDSPPSPADVADAFAVAAAEVDGSSAWVDLHIFA